ncbi:glycoside hydrolase family 3 N-terminal domain-containing protein [Methylovorus glucosotrophus]|uniref:Glycoside hydrolase family 3 domain protein n=1 Tax=Methylovorus glucosotrophus (strain SIP3-4) TaxID=582744 RepID=C6X7U4_METGS|nr:glycoside hydrolase family 3 N-terminal domain-containing protein [Methylovorus glucosotrophus]ACT51271.1 glycoside hydrolase family 3 domain protein [Methylovorus glucosotrophus SIP3-4]
MKSFLTALLLTLSTTAIADDFEKLIISPYTNQGDTSNYAGIIYFEGSFTHLSKDYLCKQRKLLPHQLQMVDQEGGLVVRIKEAGLIPPTPAQAQDMGLEAFKSKLDTTALNLNEKCITANLAPVADTNFNKSKYNRAYSDEPDIANKYAQAFATSMRNYGVRPTWKHFPGYSQELRNMTNLDYKYIKSYKHGFKEGMVDSSSREDIDNNMQAFKNEHADIVMLNYGIFENISHEPILFEQSIIDKARELQPHSLIMSDDISYLNLTDEKVIYLFKNIDLFLFTDYKDTVIFIKKLNELKDKGLISNELLEEKITRINKWKVSRIIT